MTFVNVLNTPTLLAAAGHRDFIHIENNGSEAIYVCYDGSEGANGANLNVNTGTPVLPNGVWTLDNVGPRIIYNKAVWAIAAVGPVNVRLQGV